MSEWMMIVKDLNALWNRSLKMKICVQEQNMAV